ncbi:MAG: hypothetical protein QG608_2306 [Actinomycetota bacterium]|nr:hypothetical protein [Actinomycetota bacterium]
MASVSGGPCLLGDSEGEIPEFDLHLTSSESHLLEKITWF